MSTFYHFHVCNDIINMLVTIPWNDIVMARSLAHIKATTEYGIETQYLDDLTVTFIQPFEHQSVINLNHYPKEERP